MSIENDNWEWALRIITEKDYWEWVLRIITEKDYWEWVHTENE